MLETYSENLERRGTARRQSCVTCEIVKFPSSGCQSVRYRARILDISESGLLVGNLPPVAAQRFGTGEDVTITIAEGPLRGLRLNLAIVRVENGRRLSKVACWGFLPPNMVLLLGSSRARDRFFPVVIPWCDPRRLGRLFGQMIPVLGAAGCLLALAWTPLAGGCKQNEGLVADASWQQVFTPPNQVSQDKDSSFGRESEVPFGKGVLLEDEFPTGPRPTLASTEAIHSPSARYMEEYAVRSPKSELQSPKSKVQSPKSKVRTTHGFFVTQDSGLRTLDSGLRTQDSGLRTQDSGFESILQKMESIDPEVGKHRNVTVMRVGTAKVCRRSRGSAVVSSQ